LVLGTREKWHVDGGRGKKKFRERRARAPVLVSRDRGAPAELIMELRAARALSLLHFLKINERFSLRYFKPRPRVAGLDR
jgi:hypothetical protein